MFAEGFFCVLLNLCQPRCSLLNVWVFPKKTGEFITIHDTVVSCSVERMLKRGWEDKRTSFFQDMDNHYLVIY